MSDLPTWDGIHVKAYLKGYADALDKASNRQWIRDIICANFFDGQEGGVVTLGRASEWMDEVSECLSEFIAELKEKP